MSFRYRLLLCLTVCTLSASAQVLTVLDKATLFPVENAEIRPAGPNTTPLFTDKTGKAILTGSSETLLIRRVGYQTLKLKPGQLSAANYTILLSEKQHELNEVVVSASRQPENQNRVAQSVRVLSQKEVQFLNQPTMADVLQQSGQVLVQKSQLGGGSPILRGFEANKVLLVVDGVRMNTAIFRGGHLQNILTLDNAVVERTEIALGPNSVLYGSDALGGVIYMQTLSPKLSDSTTPRTTANAAFRYGSAMQEKTGHLDWNIGFKKWAFLSSVTASDFDDLRQGARRNSAIGNLGLRPTYVGQENGVDIQVRNPDPNVQTPSGYRQLDVMQKVLFRPSARTSHMLNFQLSTTTDFPRYDRLTETDNQGNLRFAEWYYGPQRRTMLAYHLNQSLNHRLADDLKLTAAYQDVRESRHNRRFGNYSLQNRLEQVDVWTLNADLRKALLPVHEIRYGLEGTYNDVASRAFLTNLRTGAESSLDTRYPDGGAQTQSLAGYVSGTLDVRRSTFSYGARYAWNRLYARFNDKTFFPFPFDEVTQKNGAFTGSLGWTMRLKKDLRLSASLSSGYRVPNVDDLAKVFESVAGTLIVPNPDLEPERTYSADAGIRKTFGERVTVEAEGFYTLYNNAITTQPSTINGQTQVQYNGRLSRVVTQANAAEAYLYGFSGQLSARLTNALEAFGTVTYTYGRIRTDSTAYPLDHIPPVFGRGGLRLTVKRFRAEANVLFNGWKRLRDYNLIGEDNIVYATPQGMPSWQTINLRTSYQLNRHLQLQAALENLLDRNYRVFASGISAPGRNLVLTVRGNL
ncbi:TonB-dependent receptor [Tellurirhabdus rosea]|uniref:TonB-dependent receptor n=1 Tax=Tellurirhabdus rosea TaxID=2674997 RepID=UPI00224E58DC|nr:TonB-dependent receptor [Tellurirhabdus rosea]